MSDNTFYRKVSSQLCQGDVFERIPLIYLADEPRQLHVTNVVGREHLLEQGEILDPLHPPDKSSGLQVVARCDFTRAILLTYDCEIDKPATKHLTVALIRPLDSSMPAQSRQIIRENRKLSTFYLPSHDESLGESLVDFMRVSTISKELLTSTSRLA